MKNARKKLEQLLFWGCWDHLMLLCLASMIPFVS